MPKSSRSVKSDGASRKGPKQIANLLRVASLVYQDLNTPKSLALFLLTKELLKRTRSNASRGRSIDWCVQHDQVSADILREILSIRFNPSDYSLFVTASCKASLAERIRRDYQAAKLLSKIPAKIKGVDRKAAALAAFLGAEKQCGVTNRRFLRFHEEHSSHDPGLMNILFTARKILAKILGKCDYDQAISLSSFGPGATKQCSGTNPLPKKLSTSVVTSRNALTISSHVIGHSPIWFEAITGIKPDGNCCLLGIEVDDSDRLLFVDKKWDTDRPICKSHTINVFLQKGFGSLIRRRLKRAGIDLDDQSYNQKLAREGSREDSYATIDLSSASDTVAYEFVRFMLPADWFHALDSLRTKYTEMPDGTRLLLRKFSAMGNGYTFELESALFYALAQACSRNRVVSVFGDDIIVPSDCVSDLLEILTFCGFSVNSDKSYWSGPFRESCGHDFIYGLDVRPFFLRKEEICVYRSEVVFDVANQIYDWHRRHCYHDSGGLLNRAYGYLYHSIDAAHRFFVPPSGNSEAGFKSCQPPPDAKRRDGFQGWFVRTRNAVNPSMIMDDVSALAARLYAVQRPVTDQQYFRWLRSAISPVYHLSAKDLEGSGMGNKFAHRAKPRSVRRKNQMTYVFDWS